VSTSAGSVTNNGKDSRQVSARIGYYGQFTPQFAVGAAYATKMSMDEFSKYKGLSPSRVGSISRRTGASASRSGRRRSG
jgi:hypothetical protein